MKSKLLKLTSIAAVAAGTAGTALAAANWPATIDEDINRRPDAEELTPCHDSADAVSTALSPEAPWVSLALTNAVRIDLSAEQVRQLAALRGEFEQEAATRSRTMATAERDLQQQLAGQPVDLQRVRTQLDTIADLRATYRLRRIETLLAGRGILTATQQERLQELVSQATAAMHRTLMQSVREQEPAERSGIRM